MGLDTDSAVGMMEKGMTMGNHQAIPVKHGEKAIARVTALDVTGCYGPVTACAGNTLPLLSSSVETMMKPESRN